MIRILLAVVAYHSILHAENRQPLCKGVVVYAPDAFEWTKTEKELVCNELGPKPWSQIPTTQKKYFLTNFLQNRGFHFPEFRQKNGVLTVQSGEMTKIENIVFHGSSINPQRFWQVYGEALTPQNLNRIEDWLRQEMGRIGHPCIELQTTAIAKTGTIEVVVRSEGVKSIDQISSKGISGLQPKTERRYDAFHNSYDALKMDLTSKRLVGDELVVSSHFSTKCGKKDLSVKQHFLAGAPRLVSFGIGFDTEEYAIFQASWRNTRFTDTASSLSASARFSYRIQKILLGSDWYFNPSRLFWKNTAEITRENESKFLTQTFEFKSGPAWNIDFENVRWHVWPGFSYQRNEVLEGGGERITDSVNLRLVSHWQSHEYEFFSGNPRTGFEFGTDSRIANQDFASEISYQTHKLYGTTLFNFKRLSPPVWIAGVRYKVAATFPTGETEDYQVPVNHWQRLGGSSDLRGFGRQELPGDGAYLIGYVGFELRLNNIVPFGVQPIAFLDYGKIGENKLSFSPDAYYSPGLGVQWDSPVGTIRGSLAYGMSSEVKVKSSLQAYVSLGEHF